MIVTVKEYSERFKLGGKYVCPETVKRRCKSNLLPSNHIPYKLGGRNGVWVIEVKE